MVLIAQTLLVDPRSEGSSICPRMSAHLKRWDITNMRSGQPQNAGTVAIVCMDVGTCLFFSGS